MQHFCPRSLSFERSTKIRLSLTQDWEYLNARCTHLTKCGCKLISKTILCILLSCIVLQIGSALKLCTLSCTAMHRSKLFCTFLHCSILSCPALHCLALFSFTIIHCLALSYTFLHCQPLSCIVNHLLALSCTVLHCISLSYTVFHYPTLSCTVLQYSFLHCPAGSKIHMAGSRAFLALPWYESNDMQIF